MNTLERSYAAYLEDLKHNGDVLWYGFEVVKFKLAQKTTYTPDFLVLMKNETLEAHEVKGFWEDDARVKIKVAAEMFPIQFVAIKKNKGLWEYEYFNQTKEAV